MTSEGINKEMYEAVLRDDEDDVQAGLEATIGQTRTDKRRVYESALGLAVKYRRAVALKTLAEFINNPYDFDLLDGAFNSAARNHDVLCFGALAFTRHISEEEAVYTLGVYAARHGFIGGLDIHKKEAHDLEQAVIDDETLIRCADDPAAKARVRWWCGAQ